MRAATSEDDLTDEALLTGLHFDAMDLRGRQARLVEIVGCVLQGGSLAESRIEKLSLVDARLAGVDLATVTAEHAGLTRVEIAGCRAVGLTMPKAMFRHVAVSDTLLDMSALRFSTLDHVAFTDCVLRNADFVGADLMRCVFTRCDLREAEFSQVRAKGARFVDCAWDGVRGLADLRGATIVTSSPVDAEALLRVFAANAGISLVGPDQAEQ